MGELVSVLGDQNDHGGAALSCDNNPNKVFVQGKLLGLKDCTAASDLLLHVPPLTNPSGASSKVFACGIPVHRDKDVRYCGSPTIVSGQTKVFAG